MSIPLCGYSYTYGFDPNDPHGRLLGQIHAPRHREHKLTRSLDLLCHLHYEIWLVEFVFLLEISISDNLLESDLLQKSSEMVLPQWEQSEMMDRTIRISVLQPDALISNKTRLDVNCIPDIVVFMFTGESSI